MKMAKTQTTLLLLVCLSLGFGMIFPMFDKRWTAEAFTTTTVEYYWNALGSGGWTTNPAYMYDSGLTTYASTTTNGQTETLSGTTCTGAWLGEITKIELRAYGYKTITIGSAKVNFVVNGGATNQWTPGNSAGYSSYYNVTADVAKNWNAVKTASVAVTSVLTGVGSTDFVGKVFIRVTYKVRAWATKASGWNTFGNTASWVTKTSGWNTFGNVSTWDNTSSGWNTFNNTVGWNTIDSGWNTFGNGTGAVVAKQEKNFYHAHILPVGIIFILYGGCLFFAVKRRKEKKKDEQHSETVSNER